MKAIIVNEPGSYEVLKLKEINEPEPRDNQVKIQVAYCSLNPLDTHSRAARVSWGAPKMPYTPGYEYSGKIVKIGKGVDNEFLNQKVAVVGEWGGNAEFAVANLKSIIKIPNYIDWKKASCISTCGPTAWHLVNSAGNVQKSDKVLIHSAAGAVGILACQIAREKGAEVYGLVGDNIKGEYAKKFGYNHIINRSRKDWDKIVNEITNNEGVNLIIDGVGGSESSLNYKVISALGKIIYLGQTGGPPPDINVSTIISKSFSVEGFVQFFHQIKNKYQENKEIYSKISKDEWILPINNLYEIDEVPEIHKLFEERKLFGKTIIKVCGEL